MLMFCINIPLELSKIFKTLKLAHLTGFIIEYL